ncbi:MAG: hypothetical protein KDD11_15600 [Acidobacteria bacterium]|nr:hypothetical protein [Acidobacteriota bacterium]
MTIALTVAALVLVGVAAAHSYLGERYILIRLFRRDQLPKLFGGTEFTRRTLRFAWHLTSLAWLGFAAILVLLARGPLEAAAVGGVVGGTFLVHGLVVLLASRGRHLAWIPFLLVGVLTLLAVAG